MCSNKQLHVFEIKTQREKMEPIEEAKAQKKKKPLVGARSFPVLGGQAAEDGGTTVRTFFILCTPELQIDTNVCRVVQALVRQQKMQPTWSRVRIRIVLTIPQGTSESAALEVWRMLLRTELSELDIGVEEQDFNRDRWSLECLEIPISPTGVYRLCVGFGRTVGGRNKAVRDELVIEPVASAVAKWPTRLSRDPAALFDLSRAVALELPN